MASSAPMNPRTLRYALAGGGLLLVVAGLLLGFIPATLPSGVGCGSPWAPDTMAAGLRDDLGLGVGPGAYTGECATALHGRGVAGIVVAVFGALMILGVALLAASRQTAPPATPPAAEQG